MIEGYCAACRDDLCVDVESNPEVTTNTIVQDVIKFMEQEPAERVKEKHYKISGSNFLYKRKYTHQKSDILTKSTYSDYFICMMCEGKDIKVYKEKDDLKKSYFEFSLYADDVTNKYHKKKLCQECFCRLIGILAQEEVNKALSACKDAKNMTKK